MNFGKKIFIPLLIMQYMSSARYKLKLTIHFFNDLIYNIKEKLNLMIKEKNFIQDIVLYKTSFFI